MSTQDIRILYEELAQQFHEQSFEDVHTRCNTIIKKYYSCYPLLLQIASLLLNYYDLSQHSEDILLEVKELLIRNKTECQDVNQAALAQNLGASCLFL